MSRQRDKNNILDKLKRLASFHGRSWWGSSFLCSDLPPGKHKRKLLWHQSGSNLSCKIMETRLTWSKCNPTIMYGFTASLCTASRKSTWPMSEKITVKGGKPCHWRWLHTFLTWCVKCQNLYWRENVPEGYERGQRLLPHRWLCRLVEVPGLRQTGWSSVTSARTVTPLSRDCVPSGHVTPIMIIMVIWKKSQRKVPAQLHRQHNKKQIFVAFHCQGCQGCVALQGYCTTFWDIKDP